MSRDSLNDQAWEKLFQEYGILEKIKQRGFFNISADQIKKEREPRLMVKFDHSVSRPKIFCNNRLSILPITRGDYVISAFDAYHKLEQLERVITRKPLPPYIQSLDSSKITSEAIALNCAIVSGVMNDFLGEEELFPTVSGRMSSGSFDFSIDGITGTPLSVSINNSQIEIDGAYEGKNSLALVEAKRELADDFLIRQLYYPYRTWKNRLTKVVRPIFLVYTNGIYHIYEYKFDDDNNYNSIKLVQKKCYSIERATITKSDVQKLMQDIKREEEPTISFPQADSFDRVINICELLDERNMSREDVTEHYAFNARQTNYYTDAAHYLGLLNKIETEDGKPYYQLSEKGKDILRQDYKSKQLMFCACILSHKVFYEVLKTYFCRDEMPDNGRIVQIMKDSNLYNIKADSTFLRRASTVKGWVKWIINLIK